MWRRSLHNKILTLYVCSVFSSFFAAVSCFLCKIHGICPLFCDGYVVTKTHVWLMCVLHVEHNVRLALVLESLCCHQICPLQFQLVLLKNKKDIVIVGAWRSWHLLSQYCLQSWGCIQGMNFVAVYMSHTWFLSEHFWHGPDTYQIVMPVFMSIFLDSHHTFLFCTHGYSFKYSAFLTDVLHFSSWGPIVFLVVHIVFFPKVISEIL